MLMGLMGSTCYRGQSVTGVKVSLAFHLSNRMPNFGSASVIGQSASNFNKSVTAQKPILQVYSILLVYWIHESKEFESCIDPVFLNEKKIIQFSSKINAEIKIVIFGVYT